MAEGGMSYVWLAEGPEGPVVIKEPKLEDPNIRRYSVAKLRHEFKVLKMLREVEGAIKAIDGFEVTWIQRGERREEFAENPPIVVLEYIDGVTLDRAKVPMKEREVRDVVVRVLKTLSQVHALNVVHRDLKPQNLMQDRARVVKIIDFGTSAHLYDRATEYVMSPGGYTAPEQLVGHAFPQSDIWSVAAIALYLLTGKHPCNFMQGYPCNPQFNVAYRPAIVVKGLDLSDQMFQFLYRGLQPSYALRPASAAEALAILEGGVVSQVEQGAISLVVKGRTVTLHQTTVVGRTNDPKMDLKLEGDILYIYDPNRYISSRHIELVKRHDGWYVRDLGSLNGTAIVRNNTLITLWKNYGKPSNLLKLENGDVISLAYREDKGHYVAITVRI